MKHFLLTLMCCLLGSFFAAQAEEEMHTVLTFNMVDGSQLGFRLTHSPSLSFDGSFITITCADKPETVVNKFDVNDFGFTKVAAGINDVLTDAESPIVELLGNGQLLVAGCAAGTQLTVTDVNGRQLTAIKLTNGENTIDLSHYTGSVIIVSLGGKQTFKFTNR